MSTGMNLQIDGLLSRWDPKSGCKGNNMNNNVNAGYRPHILKREGNCERSEQ